MKRFAALVLFSVAPSVALAFPQTIKCTFDHGSFTTLKAGKIKSETAGKMELVFDDIDLNARHARMVGNAGATDISVIGGSANVHLIEQTPSGNLNVATVYINDSNKGPYFSAYARHVGNSAAPMVTHLTGECISFE